MTDSTQSSLDMHKANLQLATRIVKLLEQQSQQSLELAIRLMDERINACDATIEALQKTGDWQTLAALPSEAFWRQLHQLTGDSQALSQAALRLQTHVAASLQEAIQEWQRQALLAFKNSMPGAGGTIPAFSESAWTELLRPWNPWFGATAPDAKESK
ncbi:hypothetical protein AAV94_06065 [Lampropedia cohaerens]|uniref:Phasin domain-containing protein n=1 Tax=Lampropedia cohaerens TaxID=1610491 RepID=A0A0U1Q0E5_9BURK|nr:phasin family protein [Lampropedia cohaerens]KKW68227.1 hypothetical protein AAV94_06065 [Lampropedia cohaerens]